MFDGPDYNAMMNDAQDAFNKNPCVKTANAWLDLATDLACKGLITAEDYDFVFETVYLVYDPSVSTCQN